MFAKSLVIELIVAFMLASVSLAQPGDQPANLRNDLRNRKPSFLVRVEANHRSGEYREGDAFSLKIASEKDAYVYVLNQRTDGRTVLLFPNDKQPNNFVAARQAIGVPAEADLRRWVIEPPFGKEAIKVIASTRPVKTLGQVDLQSALTNPLPAKTLKGVELELGDAAPVGWAEHDLVIHTYAKNAAVVNPGARRFGVFFGVSEHQFNGEYEKATGKPMNLPDSHRDAKRFHEVMKDLGQLGGPPAIFTNALATKKQMEETITQWLPAVSRPGDTVVMFFSGHGMQIPDDNGDEPDGKDELLAPYDTVTLGILDQIAGKVKRGEEVDITPERLKHLLQIFAKSKDRASEMLMRETAVTDDLMARWLQRLEGRQVILILDCCNSGGFLSPEKGVQEKATPIRFDFLDGELGRLKDIGQRDTVVLSTCRAIEAITVPKRGELPEDLSYMTYYLVEMLEKSRGPVPMDAAYQYCHDHMKEFFEKRKQHVFLPYYQNHCSRPVYLKP